MIVLGVETTCDETACAIVKNGEQILSNVISTQIDLHNEYGGVVPELACRRHVDVLIPVIDEALTQAQVTLSDVDVLAVSYGPGLVGPLLIGVNAVKALAIALNKPFVGVNHIEAHLYAAYMSRAKSLTFPAIGVVISGGHTSLVLIKDIGVYELLGQTIDDAIGEAFDKVAKILNLPYPGGPEIEKLALHGDSAAYPFKAGVVKEKPLYFSFSGLKTSVLYTLKGQNAQNATFTLTEAQQANIAASFQKAALSDVVNKTLLAAKKHHCSQILFGGGVTNNQRLREMFLEANPHLDYVWPSLGLSLDNAAMIAGLGFHVFKKKGCGDPLDLEVCTSLGF